MPHITELKLCFQQNEVVRHLTLIFFIMLFCYPQTVPTISSNYSLSSEKIADIFVNRTDIEDRFLLVRMLLLTCSLLMTYTIF